MKFIDEATINVKAGHGGPGSRHFRREKYIPRGGPDGGNGGRGGSVVLVADKGKHTLLDFRFQPLWKAEDGGSGGSSGKDGKAGEDLVVLVPVGTQVFTEEGELVVDLDEDGKRFVLVKGGRGGKGNTFFATPTNRAPEHAQPGEEGAEGSFRFSLKLLADVGLLGFPNAGKSSFVSRISAARPKVADYPFTTLEPNLGVVRSKAGPFVVADIPGLIEGASEGKGLGIRFLKHIERTKILAHLIDSWPMIEADSIDPAIEAFHTLNKELRAFSEDASSQAQIVVITKADLGLSEELFLSAKAHFEALGYECVLVSTASGQGIDDLIERLSDYVYRFRPTIKPMITPKVLASDSPFGEIVSANEIQAAAERALALHQSWHFHILAPDCRLRAEEDSDTQENFFLVFENSTEKRICHSVFSERPSSFGASLLKLLHGENILDTAKNVSEELPFSQDFLDLLSRAKALHARGIAWHHHLFLPTCIFNPNPGQWTLSLEDPEQHTTLSAIFESEPLHELQQLEPLFYAAKK